MGKQEPETKFFPLDKKVLAVILGVSFLFCIVSTIFSRFWQEKMEFENLNKDIAYFKSVILPAITNSVWKMDFEQSKVHLQGLMSNPNIARILIQDIDGAKTTLLDVSKEERLHNLTERIFDLRSPNEETAVFAKLTLYVTLDPMFSRINTETMKQFILITLQIFIFSLLLLHVFRVVVMDRILKLSKYFRANSYISQDTPVLARDTKILYYDEIENLTEAINRTVNESKKYQQQIEELKDRADRANQAKSLFLASINHELRTPLTTILGVCDLLPEAANNHAKLKSMLELQKRSGLHLRHLVDEILDLSKIEAGQLRIDYSCIDLKETMRTCQLLLEKAITEKGNQLELHIDKDFPESISGDPERINQIVINLISNANKFTNQGKIIVHVSANRITNRNSSIDGNSAGAIFSDQKNYEIKVTDTGKGIPKDKLNEIFLPFRQLESGPRELKKGTGIGLSIAKQLTELMGGEISVESELGKGTTFKVHLPLKVMERDLSVRSAMDDSPLPKLKSNLKLLVAEDTEEIRTLVSGYLKHTDAEVSFAQNGEECLGLYKKGNFSLILMDLQMPVMDGWETTKQIREIETQIKIPHIPILAMTALTTKSDIDSAMKSGFDGYMTKPFSRAKLLHTVQEHTSG